jgi:protein SCO1/2
VSTRRGPRAAGLLALLAAGALLAGCGGTAEADGGSGGHDHAAGEAPATVSGPSNPYDGLYLQSPYQKPEFTLTDQTGAPYDFQAQTADGPTLLFFGYTNCPDICPTTMADVAIALQSVDPAVAEKTHVVFVTTDPARDSAPVLGEYLARFGTGQAPAIVGLTGDQAQIDAAQLAAGVPLAEEMGQQHSSLLLLYGTDGQASVAFDAGNTSRDIAHDLAIVAGE